MVIHEEAKKGKYKIGVISQDVKEGFTQFNKGQLVLFEPYTAKECYGKMLYADIKTHCQLCTTCIPYLKNDKVYTASCCVGVPLSLISYEIKFQNG